MIQHLQLKIDIMVNNESDYMCFSFQIDVCFSTTLEKTVDTQRNTVITNLVKKNYFMSQVDKYIYKYDVNKNEGYILGDLGKKSTKVWNVVTAD